MKKKIEITSNEYLRLKEKSDGVCVSLVVINPTDGSEKEQVIAPSVPFYISESYVSAVAAGIRAHLVLTNIPNVQEHG